MSTVTLEGTQTGAEHLEAAKKSCEEVAHVAPGNTHEMGARLQQMILSYYGDVRKQAQQSFKVALAASGVALGFYLYAAYRGMGLEDGASQTSLIAGSLIQVIAGISFYLYGKAARQFSAFHICLERTNRYLLANTLCENLTCSVKKDTTRQEIIREILEAPMLTMDVIHHGKGKGTINMTKKDSPKEAEVNGIPLYS